MTTISEENKTVSLKINGRLIKAKPEQTILNAALESGIYIPYLCYYPGMKPYGACRTCVVSIKQGGRESLQASCTVPVSEGMEVASSDQKSTQLRKNVLDLLVSEHPHGCLTCHRIELCGPQDVCQRHVGVTDRCTICPKNERCELKDTVRSADLELKTDYRYNRRNLPIHTDDPFYDRDYNLCIVCARCVRVCEEVRFDSALTLTSRSGVALVGTARGVSLLESGCEFCGACIDVCPTGALVEREYKWEKAKKEVTTTCMNCSVGCQMVAEVNSFDKVVRFKGDLAGKANFGQACFKGKFGYDYVNHKKRLKHPLVKTNSGHEKLSITEAYTTIAKKLSAYKGGDIAVIGSPRATNEEALTLARFAREVLKTKNIDSAHNFAPEVGKVLEKTFGFSGSTNSIWDIEKSDLVVVLGGNPTEEQNVLAVPLKRALREGKKLFVIDPRETELTRYSKEGWIQLKPGFELAFITALIKVILDEGLTNKRFLASHVKDTTALRTSILNFDIGNLAKKCGIEESTIRQFARTLCKSKTSFVVGGDYLKPKERNALAQLVVNLALLTGNINDEGCGIYPLYEGANTLGSSGVGCAPKDGGLEIGEIVEAVDANKIKAVLLVADGVNPNLEPLKKLKEVASKLDFLFVLSPFENELTKYADVVLPATTYAEKEGTSTNLEGRIQKVSKLFETKYEEQGLTEVCSKLSQLILVRDFDFKKEEAELLKPFFESCKRSLEKEVDKDHTGYTLEGLPIEVIRKTTENETPLVFAMGRVLVKESLPKISKTKDGDNFIDEEEKSLIHLHKEDASEAGLIVGDSFNLVDTSGKLVASGKAIFDGNKKGVLYKTDLFGELATGMQNDETPDPASYLTGLSIFSVTIQPHKTTKLEKPVKPTKPVKPLKTNKTKATHTKKSGLKKERPTT